MKRDPMALGSTAPLEMQRIGQALRAPGIDPRSWVLPARVDDDPEAIRWDEKSGWVVDVTLGGGGDLDGEGPIPCRVASWLAGAGSRASAPIGRDCEVVVGVLAGQISTPPVILGFLNNAGGCDAPTSVNGNPVNKAFAEANVFLATDKGLQEEYGDDWSVGVPDGNEMRLGSDVASESYVLGDQYQAALNTFLDAFETWSATVLGPTPAQNVALVAAITALKNVPYLSAKIKGE